MNEEHPTAPRTDPELHVVLGAGQVGPLLAEHLLAAGRRVRIVRRGEAGAARPNLSWVRADLSDPAQAAEAFAGADVVYDCTNPSSYASWPSVLPPLKRGIWQGVRRSGPFLVTLDNLYMYGTPEDGVLREDTPVRPSSDKGRLRAELSRELMDMSARGELRGAVGRASDFFGPGAGAMSFFGDRFVRGLASGWGAAVLGNPDLPRSYSYVPDVACGLATLGSHRRESEGRIFHLPVAWKHGTTRAFATLHAQALGRTVRLWRLPNWLFSVLGVASADLGAVREMVYQWESPYVVEDALFERTFGVGATPMSEAVAQSLLAAGASAAGAVLPPAHA